MNLKNRLHRFLLFSAAVAAPGLASACAVCFSGASKDLSRGFFWGILLLLVLPFSLAGAIITAVVRGSRKSRPS